MPNGHLAVQFLDRLTALDLSTAKISKYSSHLRTLLKIIKFNIKTATRKQIEKDVLLIINLKEEKEKLR